MSNPEENPNTIIFTEQESLQHHKEIVMIQQNFLQQHPEIAIKGNGELTNLLRDEKCLYANMAISYAVTAIKAMEKKQAK